MQQPLAFLSYTRTDDEFFGGYIKAFRKTLQNAVHVVSGEKRFQLFQDVEGIIIGENWQKKLGEVIHQSSFFVPMLSPLFFNSKPCRDEVKEFLQHERTLKRDDLVLPVYFLTSAKLEKEEERVKDAIAQELGKRQIFDWRQNADIPLEEPKARRAILELAGEIGERLETFNLRSAAEDQPPVAERTYEGFAADPQIGAGVPANLRREALSPRTVLWVDDNPDNNVWERRALESYGVCFVLARDTATAERLLGDKRRFTAIISDMGRTGDRLAGYTLLNRVRKRLKLDTPFFIYTSVRAARLWPVARLRGAQGLTADPDELVQMVLTAIR